MALVACLGRAVQDAVDGMRFAPVPRLREGVEWDATFPLPRSGTSENARIVFSIFIYSLPMLTSNHLFFSVDTCLSSFGQRRWGSQPVLTRRCVHECPIPIQPSWVYGDVLSCLSLMDTTLRVGVAHQ